MLFDVCKISLCTCSVNNLSENILELNKFVFMWALLDLTDNYLQALKIRDQWSTFKSFNYWTKHQHKVHGESKRTSLTWQPLLRSLCKPVIKPNTLPHSFPWILIVGVCCVTPPYLKNSPVVKFLACSRHFPLLTLTA